MTTSVVPSPEPEQSLPHPGRAPWSLWRRVLLLFLFLYFVLFWLPDIVYIPGVQIVSERYYALWQAVSLWVGSRFFRLTGSSVPTGIGGDSTVNYIHRLLTMLLAFAAALIWSVLDRQRNDYRDLQAWLRLLVRYALAIALLEYGFDKVFPVQFRAFGLQRLIEPYGDFSPMGALWSFMAASTPYTIFAGSSEVLAGLLLLFRRTATLGSLVAFGVLLNVVMLNFCYDVPVKLYSSELLLMAVYLASPDLRRLFDFFVRNRATSPADLTRPRFGRRSLRIAAVMFQIVLVGSALFDSIYSGWKTYETVRVHPVRPPIYGLWEVEAFTRNGLDVPAIVTDGSRWRRIIADSPESVTVKMMNDGTKDYAAKYDASRKTITLVDSEDKTKKYLLNYSRSDTGDHLTIDGSLSNDRVSMRLRRINTAGFVLLNRGFHWISEAAFFR